MTLIANERTKLTATWFNGISIALFAVGGLAPVFSVVYGNSNPANSVSLVTAICVIVSTILHLVARYVLKGLRS